MIRIHGRPAARRPRAAAVLVTAAAAAAALLVPTASASAGPAPASPASADPGVPVTVWASNVRLHNAPHVAAPSPAEFGPGELIDICQTPGDTVTEPQGTSSWWSLVELPGGSDALYMSNVFIKGGEKIAGVPDC
ncbi:peptidase M23 [Streptomyces fuscigenes]|uniref:peptidase M23 n=1 Tax=Streptomyces fuscigenes TaxID=1528880 RepID=UPI001F439743|nr:peptidase M23 [Streptomyces fuscigenes]MCF3965063.1 peptidase M23 [Streptomyces fuscigenes]